MTTSSVSLSNEESSLDKMSYELLKLELNAPLEAPLYRRMSIGLENLIRTGVLRPGQQLPSERDLTLHLGISRRTVRAALSELIENKQLVPVHGKGNFVRRERRALTELVVPERFLPNHWGQRPYHYQWILDAAKQTQSSVRYVYAPDLETLDQTLKFPENRREGVLLFRPSQEWLDHLKHLPRDRKTIQLRPIMVVNRDCPLDTVNFVTDDHENAVAQSVRILAEQTPGALGLVTSSSEQPYAKDHKRGYRRVLREMGRTEESENYLEIPLTDLQDKRAEDTLLTFIRDRRLCGLIVAGSAFETTLLSAYRRLEAVRRRNLRVVLFTETMQNKIPLANWTYYIEPDHKVLLEAMNSLRDILDDADQAPVHQRVLGEFLEAGRQAVSKNQTVKR